jgi:abortive infection alpha-like protein
MHEEPRDENPSLVRALPTLVRMAGVAWWRTAEWTLDSSARAGSRVVRAAIAGESPAELLQETGADVRDYLRRLLGLVEDGSRPSEAATAESDTAAPEPATTARLREQGAELLRRSADVDLHEDAHPAYARILSELAPDEGRILRLLVLEGPRPSVDVRTGGPLGVIKSDLVAPGLSMIAAEAGCRRPEEVHPYLNNLNRLGLVWFSREPLDDVQLYQVLEAQPEVAEAMRAAGHARTVRRSIHLTPFGEDFCRTCLPLETAEVEALPETDGS